VSAAAVVAGVGVGVAVVGLAAMVAGGPMKLLDVAGGVNGGDVG
jgi:hypothetical protein